jgi:acyl-CoA synthetase (AMP-forming)/AMP-acid ligase II
LHTTFPDSRITNIYASTEIAFGFSVSDMLSGFPRDYLEREFARFKLINIDGELAIEFRSSQNELKQEVFLTGDLISVNDSRVQFSGRRTNIVNIGGNKVNPEEVERAISELHGVKEVRVFGIPSSRLGEILTAEVVTNGSLTGQEVRIELKKILPPYKIPANVEVVREIKLNSSGKIVRS